MLRIGIIGYGYWGPNIARNFFEHPGCTLHAVADIDAGALSQARKKYPTALTTRDYRDILKSPDIDAVAIATPVSTHYAYAREALLAGKHVLVEKPLTTRSDHARELIELSEKLGKVLMVDHTFLFTGAVEKIKEILDAGEIGNIQYIDSTRINLGLFQPDVNVLWDLATHDLSVINYFIRERPATIQAIGADHLRNRIHNIAYLIMKYDSGMIVHLNCSWTSPVKIRQMLIGGDRKMIVYNDIEPTDKVKVYDRGYAVKSSDEIRQFLVDYRLGDAVVPKVSMREALAGVVDEFYRAITTGIRTRSGGIEGLEIVTMLEAADKSLHNGGEAVSYQPPSTVDR